MSIDFRIVIPARFASQRLPGKPLRELAGKPLIRWVYEKAQACGAKEVIVATDDARIADACNGFDAPIEMTSAAHASGSDRIAEVAARRGWHDADVVVNVQGDEPLLATENITQVASLAAGVGVDIATLAMPIETIDEYRDTNVVKVVSDAGGDALYFSRAPLPWFRDIDLDSLSVAALAEQLRMARRHLGLYAYRVAALSRLAAAPVADLEHCEKLEQLRALSLGMRIAIADAERRPGPGVDTAEDLAFVETRLQAEAVE